MKQRISRAGMVFGALTVWAIAPAASAADAAKSGGGLLDEVVVTASKRAERQQDVGSSVSVIGAADLEQMHVASLVDLAGSVAGLVINNNGGPGQTSVVVRGLNSQAMGSLVATLIDDTAVGSSGGWVREDSYQLDMMPYDIDRIEVLRGPQGTLYGANSMGGVLKYVTKFPSLNASEAQAGVEGFDVAGGGSAGYGARAAYGTPLVDGVLAARISVYDRNTPGFIKNPTLGNDHENSTAQHGGRVALLWQPTADLNFKLQGIYQRIYSDGMNYVWAQPLGGPQTYTPGRFLVGDGVWAHPVPESFDSNLKYYSLTVNWDLKFAFVSSATAYSDKYQSNPTDQTFGYGFLQPLLDPATTSVNDRFRLDTAAKKLTEELRIASPTGQRLEWLLGFYYTNEKATNNQYLDALDQNLQLIPELTPFAVIHIPTTYKERAAFANVTFKITDALDITGGLRRLHNDQVVEQIEGGAILAPSHTVAPASADITNYLAGVRYHFSRDSMVYARVGDGYRPGAPNVVNPLYPMIPPTTTADTMKSYELGLKSDFLERRASVDFAIYKIDWNGLQTVALTPDGNVGYGINAGPVVSQGAELSVTYEPSPALRLNGNIAYTDVHATQTFITPGYTIDDGAKMPTAPKWTASLKADYQFSRLGDWTPRLSAAWRYLDSEYSTFSSAALVGIIPGYSLVDFNLGGTSSRYDVNLYARNALNKRAYNSGYPALNNLNGVPYFTGSLLQPRTVGLSVDVHF